MKIDPVAEEIVSALEEANQLRVELKGYDHDCKLDSKGFCNWCAKVETANLYYLRKMTKEMDEAREDAEYEPPTPSDTADAVEHFGADAEKIGESESQIL